jgi:hypothetical protein
MIRGRGPDGAGSELAAVVIDRDNGVSALVRIDPESDHGRCLLRVVLDNEGHGSTGGHIPVRGSELVKLSV